MAKLRIVDVDVFVSDFGQSDIGSAYGSPRTLLGILQDSLDCVGVANSGFFSRLWNMGFTDPAANFWIMLAFIPRTLAESF